MPTFKAGKKPLWYAAANGNFDICEFLIESATDKNPKSRDDWTPFHVAASEGHLNVCELISDNVTDQSPVTKQGQTPLYFAAIENHLDICKLLMSRVSQRMSSEESRKKSFHLCIWPIDHDFTYGY